ncbi:MAG: hypothetical protein GY698_18640 [Actinomycetia bacterium]|nr:hypothetical protein [Actinomycetes bacterium]
MTPEPSGSSAYAGGIHPDIALDLREETGSAAWSDPVAYSAADRRWNNELGKFEGVRWITSPRAEVWANGGDGNVDVYGTIICGQQALAKLYSSVTGPTAQVRFGAITDNLMRERPAGWLWIGGYGRFREASLQRIEAMSSIGDNT